MSKIDNKLWKLLSAVLGSSSGTSNRNKTTVTNGTSTSAYNAGQMDSDISNVGNSGALNGVGSGLLGLITAGATMLYNNWQGNKAYARQNEYYENHLSMQAKMDEYRNAGLNPMGLAGAGVGATSAPSVEQPAPVDIGQVLGSVIGAINQTKEVAARNAYTKSQTVAQEIDNRYQEQIKQLEIRERSAKAAREELGYDIDMQTLRMATTDASMREVLAVYYPSMLQADITNKEAQAALSTAQASLTAEQEKQVEQQISQAEERFPEEMAQLRAKTAEIQANTTYLQEQTSLTAEQRKEIIERTKNLIEDRKLIIAKTKLTNKEYDCYNAIHSEVTVVPDTTGNKDRVIVKSPDGKVRQFDMKGMEYNRARNLDGSKAK